MWSCQNNDGLSKYCRYKIVNIRQALCLYHFSVSTLHWHCQLKKKSTFDLRGPSLKSSFCQTRLKGLHYMLALKNCGTNANSEHTNSAHSHHKNIGVKYPKFFQHVRVAHRLQWDIQYKVPMLILELILSQSKFVKMKRCYISPFCNIRDGPSFERRSPAYLQGGNQFFISADNVNVE